MNYFPAREKQKFIKMIIPNFGIDFCSPPIFYPNTAIVFNNELHLLGSTTVAQDKTKHYKWDASSDLWIEVSTLPYSFANGSAVVLNGEIHILGGLGSDAAKKHYKWNGSTWTEVSTLPYNFVNGSAVVLNGEIHILGSDRTDTPRKHYKWDGETWTEVSTLPYSFATGSAVVLNGEIHILGGYISNEKKHYKWNGSTWTEVSTLPFNAGWNFSFIMHGRMWIAGMGKLAVWNGIEWVDHGNGAKSMDISGCGTAYNGIHNFNSTTSGSSYVTSHRSFWTTIYTPID